MTALFLGRFALSRPGVGAGSPLRAWDAADEYVLDELSPEDAGPVAVVNDAFGALAVALADRGAMSVSDSFVATEAARTNLRANDGAMVRFVPSTEPFPDGPAFIIIKVPRTLSLLEHQLHSIRSAVGADCRIVGAGMVKNVHTSTLKLFEQILGPTTTSLAKKKARLIYTEVDPDLNPPPNPWPRSVTLEGGLEVVAEPGVFAGTKLDIGARAMLETLPGEFSGAVDLGCGNGILGTALARSGQGEVTFVDESHLAVRSAQRTFEANHPDRTARFVVDDAGSSLPDAGFDLVLNNPPFHESNAITDATAWRMFTESHRMLAAGGELRVVGNRHLGYHVKLKRIFGNCTTIHSTRKFVVLSAKR